MIRDRYWKLTSEEVEKLNYNTQKVLNWEIKCIREPEENAEFIGVFLYKHGTPFDYNLIKGITYYHNNIERKDVPEIAKFLKSKVGGEEKERGERGFLEGSKEIFSGKEVGQLAKDLESKFKAKASISIEFEDLTEEEKVQSGLPTAKLLPVPGGR
ncbi:MAG: hypothetical protein WD154_02825 [Nitrosopumilaceae archaeon]